MALWFGLGAFAQEGGASATLDEAFRQLADPDNPDWESAQTRILDEWSRSGSPAVDLLLKRGRDAMVVGDLGTAIEHFTALTDQAPDFAEGWNARATAYYMSGLYGPSIVDIERVLFLEPRHFGAISGLGLMLEEIGNEEEAARAYRESLAINPHQDGIRQALDALERDLSGTEL